MEDRRKKKKGKRIQGGRRRGKRKGGLLSEIIKIKHSDAILTIETEKARQ